jgi:hypothetical protein
VGFYQRIQGVLKTRQAGQGKRSCGGFLKSATSRPRGLSRGGDRTGGAFKKVRVSRSPKNQKTCQVENREANDFFLRRLSKRSGIEVDPASNRPGGGAPDSAAASPNAARIENGRSTWAVRGMQGFLF